MSYRRGKKRVDPETPRLCACGCGELLTGSNNACLPFHTQRLTREQKSVLYGGANSDRFVKCATEGCAGRVKRGGKYDLCATCRPRVRQPHSEEAKAKAREQWQRQHGSDGLSPGWL